MRVIAGEQFEVLDVPADGNCLFAAFSCGLIGCDALGVELRHDAVRTVVGDWATYGVLTSTEDGKPYDNQLIYADVMSRATTYGGIAEVTALCSLYRCTALIYEGNECVANVNEGCIDVVRLLYRRQGAHYSALQTVTIDPPEPLPDVNRIEKDGGAGGYDDGPDVTDEDIFAEDDMEIVPREGGGSPCEDIFAEYLPRGHAVGSACLRPQRVRPLQGAVSCKPSRALLGLTMPLTYMWARLYAEERTEDIESVTLGDFDFPCSQCGALYWRAERLCESQTEVPYWCCGKTVRTELGESGMFSEIREADVRDLFMSDSEEAIHFRRHARAYNSVLSVGMPCIRYDRTDVRSEYVIAVNGRATFSAPSYPAVDDNGIPVHPGAMYFVDMSEDIIAKRVEHSTDPYIRPHIVEMLERYLRQHNAFVRTFMLAKDIMAAQNADRELGSHTGASDRGLHVLVNPHREGLRVTDRGLFDEDGNALRPAGSDFVAAVFEGEEPRYSYDVAFFPRAGGNGRRSHVRINEACPTIDNVLYVLLHLHAENSWVDIVTAPQTAKRLRESQWASKTVAPIRAYYSARIMRRGDPTQSRLFRMRGLYQQWLVDAAVKIEDAILRYAAENQDELSVCQYSSLRNYVEGIAADMQRPPGRIVILPRNRQKGERRMHSNFVDAVTISARTAKPSLFFTMTCNPRWPEIVEALRQVGLDPDEYVHAPDIVVRAFLARVNVFVSDVINKAVVGRVLSWVGVTEFTTTKLPHLHFVVNLADADRPSTPDEVDALISAEIPDEDLHPTARGLVLSLMMHRPCDGTSPNYDPKCLGRDGKCKHGFPFSFQESTVLAGKVPLYRRREGAAIWHSGFRCMVDNRWVVPYNLKMLLRHRCHLNGMVCGDNMNWPYLFGYAFKEGVGQYAQGSMLRAVQNSTSREVDWNEIEHYQAMRILGPYEAIYHILGQPFVSMSHAVQALPIHLPGKQYVYYRGEPTTETVLQENSMLLAWFRLNSEELHDTHHLLYADIVGRFKYERGNWVPKVQSNTIGRLMHVNPSPRNMELLYLRLLLLNRPGMKSFQDLLTVDGVQHGVFKEACEALGISSSGHIAYDDALVEVVQYGRPDQIRRFFSVLAAACHIGNVKELWILHRGSMSNDFRRRGFSDEESYRRTRSILIRHFIGLLDAEKETEEERLMLAEGFRRSLTLPSRQCDGIIAEVIVDDEQMDILGEDVQEHEVNDDENAVPIDGNAGSGNVQEDLHLQYYASYSEEQRLVHDTVMQTVTRGEGCNFLSLEAPAGCGKTYVYNGLIMHCHQLGLKTVACAMTAIASLLLTDGETANKVFGIPVRSRVDGTERSFLERNSQAAQALLQASLIVVDEVSMMAIWQVEIIDSLLRDLTGKSETVFGGKVVLFGGDMAQILPVMRGSTMAVVTRHSLPNWRHWSVRRTLRLTQNRRAVQDPEFCMWLSKVRDGSANINGSDDIIVPQRFIVASDGRDSTKSRKYAERQRDASLNALIEKVYGDFSDERLGSSVILSPTNSVVRGLNERILDRLPTGGSARTFMATTRVVDENPGPVRPLDNDRPSQDHVLQSETGGFQHVQEELDAVNAANLPPHRLRLKEGSIVMLLKNFNKSQGLCNGTRLRVVRIHQHVVLLQRIVPFRGRKDKMYFPKMWLRSDDVPIAGSIERFQFPFCLAFVMTINKSQGQTFDFVGLYLARPVFSPGQFYVAASRCKNGDNLYIVIERGPRQGPLRGNFGGRGLEIITKNIVIKKFL